MKRIMAAEPPPLRLRSRITALLFDMKFMAAAAAMKASSPWEKPSKRRYPIPPVRISALLNP